MNSSSNREHAASAARPPQASSLSESTGTAATTKDSPGCLAATSTSNVGTIAVPATTATKKRPLNACACCPEAAKSAAAIAGGIDQTKPMTATSTSATPFGTQEGLKISENPATTSNSTNVTIITTTTKPPLKRKVVKAKKTLKKKQRKFSSILSGMMKPKTNKDKSLAVEREALRRHLGGGNFAKVDKI
mmetsp:Transcript_7009/g.14928  ORF Transcript_7009/g.14928 Transcript_7009/m.14928 type:complete len:190 (-) Transcript_7009:328-897(-)|eukprot:CAMPEP_0168180518 /NCGR_PEP_ID=MMETSP0139_2-20121125/10588_1 /TAXON_ID=44445 /ORGANISM="Pseudo-nitzschia australis, Strain 10249 10 AB" /LENGTH=189 /DNA_ID=CAMNT_0008100757 /DNA_START=337 /DNA_END=906 /DNA_ORIENTATION=-